MSDLFNDLKGERLPPGTRCHVAILIQELDTEDRETLERVLADKAISSAALARRLRSAGYNLGNHVVQRHRRHDCLCRTEDYPNG